MFMSPVGLSQMTKLSPLSIVSFVMAVWYMALAMANLFGSWIAALASTETIGGQVLDPGAAMFPVAAGVQDHRDRRDPDRGAVPGPVADPQEMVAWVGRHRSGAGLRAGLGRP
jgi:hypothetical protein